MVRAWMIRTLCLIVLPACSDEVAPGPMASGGMSGSGGNAGAPVAGAGASGGAGGAAGASGGGAGGAAGASGGGAGGAAGGGAGGATGGGGSGAAAEEDVCESYCDEFPALCPDIFAADYPGGAEECSSTCASWMPGSLTESDGPTAWCRLKHTRAGASLPDPTHCQHAKKLPTEFCL